MTAKEYIFQQISTLDDAQTHFLKLAIKIITGKPPVDHDEIITAAVVYSLKGMNARQIANELHCSERMVHRYLAEFKQRTRQ